jgi:hypothetical protein
MQTGSGDYKLIQALKRLRTDGKLPLMYVELQGYVEYFPGYLYTSIDEVNIVNGFFVYDDQTVINLNFKNISSSTYVYRLLENTQVINCGNKFSSEHSFTKNSLLDYNKNTSTLTLYNA